jgi:hypothetical protein
VVKEKGKNKIIIVGLQEKTEESWFKILNMVVKCQQNNESTAND